MKHNCIDRVILSIVKPPDHIAVQQLYSITQFLIDLLHYFVVSRRICRSTLIRKTENLGIEMQTFNQLNV